jgi:hypothetical protein
MHIDIKALGGQRYARQFSPLLVAFCGGSLSLVFGVYGVLCHANNRLLFLVARG